MEASRDRDDKVFEIKDNLYRIHALGTVLEVDHYENGEFVIDTWENNGVASPISNMARFIKELSDKTLGLFEELESLIEK